MFQQAKDDNGGDDWCSHGNGIDSVGGRGGAVGDVRVWGLVDGSREQQLLATLPR